MFTGIVQATCELVALEKRQGMHTLAVRLPAELREGLTPGASVANNGVCLTVTRVEDDRVFFDVMEETLSLTNLGAIALGCHINIERSLTFGKEIGGHLLSGHVQCQAIVTRVTEVGEQRDLRLSVPKRWMKYILYKGFVAVNGCSLTVGEVFEDGFMLHLIPETLRLTNLKDAVTGTQLNIEIDSQTQTIVDTVERVLAARQ
ncbi:riboflavin synthase subunit alpha [Shewanella litorisediminis]|uniref:Riboflavin synthase n=1 Tax=Shewanella litorisediminis TaxID=1173586 RepID=A0ABX7G7W0_9GAMM|nr:riboflavin synthase subunit alpha [Shewanella litorisediminis]MCL2919211.1 riboflavin synthase subunit alpha [Shewanella litorisediminis]QRH03454.1 riboflavin synthase subunit alpha [Shewanella litorisediminis]